MSSNISMLGLPFTPIDAVWLAESPAFLSDDARVVRAAIMMLQHAWKTTPAGTLPASFRVLGSITGLTEIEVGQHYEHLTKGWELNGERLVHIQMEALCKRLALKFGDALTDLADASAMAMMDKEEFQLISPVPVPSRKQGKHRLPKNWFSTQEDELVFGEVGITDEADKKFVEARFRDWANADNVMKSNWSSTFRNFIRNARKSELPSAKLVPIVSPFSRSSRFGSGSGGYGTSARANDAMNHNSAMMAELVGRGN